MKNSLFLDLVTESVDKIKIAHGFAKNCGGSLDKEQKRKFKAEVNWLIDSFSVEKL